MVGRPETTRLYRVENPYIPAHPDGVVSHKDLVGQWFSPNLPTALRYLRKNTQTFGKEVHVVDGARLVIAYVTSNQLEASHVSKHTIASTMDVENDNYILPRDGSVPLEEIELDDVISDLRGKLGNFALMKEASARINEALMQHGKQ